MRLTACPRRDAPTRRGLLLRGQGGLWSILGLGPWSLVTSRCSTLAASKSAIDDNYGLYICMYVWGQAGRRTQGDTRTQHNTKPDKANQKKATEQKGKGEAGGTKRTANATHEEHKTASTANEQHPSTHTKTRHKATKQTNTHTHTHTVLRNFS